MRKKLLSRQRPHEQGQTIVLVAISLVSLLAMAALAIDIVTLYAARSEVQRAADAAALAGAKAIADSGITTLLVTDPQFTTVRPWAVNAAKAQINAVIQSNLVAGVAPSLVSPPSFDWSRQGNPQITVKLITSNLPTFFSKIWGGTTPVATAAATAEVYNPANLPNFVPIVPKAVKPWLVANIDPNTSLPFVDAAGKAEAGVIGEQLNLTADCGPPATSCTPTDNPPGIGPANNSPPGYLQVEYVPALVTAPSSPNPNVCPPCFGATDYEQSIECADVTTSYQVLSCGGGATNANWGSNIYPGGVGGLSDLGTECLIHANGTGNNKGQDAIDNLGPWPISPMTIVAGSNSAQNGNPVTTSNSIVTIPLIDRAAALLSSGPVTIDGYLQAFIEEVHGPGNPAHRGDIKITVLNIAGCNSTSTNLSVTPVVGVSGTSPVPVRLVGP